MSHKSNLIASNINAYLKKHEKKELLRFLTCGSVDDGKSTLIGRLLYDSKLILDDQLSAVETDSARVGTVENGLDLALLVDGLQAEREQGITIDVAYRYFSTDKRKFIVADTPGHEQYTRNMITGASNCDLAIIIVDARNGITKQSKRHSFIVALLGIRDIVVLINKMDLVGYKEERYQKIKSDYAAFATRLDIHHIHYLPISALRGDNVVDLSTNMSWYRGETLMTILENIQISPYKNMMDFRFPVQYVNRPNHDFRGYCGTVASGTVRKGDEIMVLPSRKTSRINSIVSYDGELEEAFHPQAVTLTIDDAIDISRGNMLVHPDNIPYFSDRADAKIVWMVDTPMHPGKQYLFKQGTCKITGSIRKIRFKIDIDTLGKIHGDKLDLNEIGHCEVRFSQRIAFDSYTSNRGTGSFIMIDRLSNATVGAGMIVGPGRDITGSIWDLEQRSKYLNATVSLISVGERNARFGQTPKTLLFTGLTGSGKSTIAYALERKLFDMGHAATVLDGQNMRLHSSRDLGFDEDDRSENIRRGIEIAKLMNQSGMITICAFVTPNDKVRKNARKTIGENFLLVFMDTPLEICKKRDARGIYEAIDEEGLMVPGVNLPYEVPDDADLVLATHEISIKESVEKLLRLLKDHETFSDLT